MKNFWRVRHVVSGYTHTTHHFKNPDNALKLMRAMTKVYKYTREVTKDTYYEHPDRKSCYILIEPVTFED